MSLKARLSKRELPTAEYPLRISDDSEARGELVAAQYELRMAEAREDAAKIKAAKAKVAKAQKKVDAHYETLKLRALPSEDMEALIAKHPAKKDSDDAWNVETFRPALIAACVEGDMTEQDWAEFLSGRNNLGEVRELFSAVLRVNDRSPDPSVGKDWMGILNSL